MPRTPTFEPEHVPSPDEEWQEIWWLALTFNGYRHWGTVKECAEVANQERNSTPTDPRTSLSLQLERWRPYGDEPDDEAAP